MPTFGDYDVTYVIEGHCWLDGGAMFGVVPRTLWERAMPPDERNRIRLACNILVLRSPSRVVIVDTGCGDKWDEKNRTIYRIEPADGGLKGALASKGVTVDDVTDVVQTHLHFDHAGGGTRRSPDGTCHPTFPRATYHVQRRHWEWALQPTERDQASFIADNLLPLQASGRLHLIDGPGELLPGIFVDLADTHTVGHQTVRVGDGDGALFHCGDVIPTSNHVRLPFIMAYDLFPLGTLAAKRDLLSRAVDERWTLFYEHDPVRPATTVKDDGRGGYVAGDTVVL